MWTAVSASVIGTSHETIGTPCQDASGLLRLRLADEEFLLVVIADGAGSASHSQIGSREAVEHLLKITSTSDRNLKETTDAHVCDWYHNVLDHLRTVALRESVAVEELACTLLLGIVWKDGAIFSQLGDGAWVIEKDGILTAATWPETGEYANVTVFVTTPGALALKEGGAPVHIQIRKTEGKISAVAGFTDGIQALTLDYAQRTPFTRFFTTVFAPLRSTENEAELTAPLKQMLASETITSRTDDDKTLVLAVWREPQPIVTDAALSQPNSTEDIVATNTNGTGIAK